MQKSSEMLTQTMILQRLAKYGVSLSRVSFWKHNKKGWITPTEYFVVGAVNRYPLYSEKEANRYIEFILAKRKKVDK